MSHAPSKEPGADRLSLSRPGTLLAPLPPSRRRRRPRMPTMLASLLIAVGALLLIDAGVTLVWQEPITALLAQIKQESLGADLRTLDHTQPTTAAQLALTHLHEERRRIAYLASELQRHSKDGSAVGFIRIPKIGADFVVVKGTGTSELESGPGIYSETNFPGIPGGTTAVAGHRTTYLAPFRHIDELHPGQSIVLEMPYARFAYRVVGSRTVLPTDVSVIKPVDYARLVLSSCTPPFSATHRLIVFARLQTAVPLGAARLPGGATRLTGSAAGVFSVPGEPALPPVLKSRQRLLAPLVS
ncbi:MAG TPA: sortase [Solirubrobacteraceae bacterium]